jgi:hypothetical protein
MHAGHLGVHQQQIQLSTPSAQYADPLKSIARLYYLTTLILKGARSEGAASGVIVDNQYGDAGRRGQAIFSHRGKHETPARRTGAIAL